MKYTDLMIDIETVGRRPGCGIIQIAAVPFNMNSGAISDNVFKMSINLQGQFNNKFSYDQNTISWWKKTNINLFNDLSSSKNSYVEVGKAFQDYFNSLEDHGKIRTWGNSARFDMGILEGWYTKAIGFNFNCFWNTWLERDVRTLSCFRPDLKKGTRFEGTPHDAIDDCKHQIKYCRKIVKATQLKIT